MKTLRVAGIPAMVVLCGGMAVGQDVAHDVDKSANKTGHVVKHVGKKVGHATKSGVKGTAHGTKDVAKDSAKGVKDAGHIVSSAAGEKLDGRIADITDGDR